MVNLSKRLEAVLGYIKGSVLADIGTDHAFLPVAAVQRGLADRAIACDISPGPLQNAALNIARHGLTEKIETRLGDGFFALKPNEADCVTLAGMGGVRVAEMFIKSHPIILNARIVAQPQQGAEILRRTLHRYGFAITGETMLREDGFFYNIIAAAPGADEGYTDAEYHFGKLLIEKKCSCLHAYIRSEHEKLKSFLLKAPGVKTLIAKEALYTGILQIFT
jgi:tRNA (adenine22-N1)-methyltransferase